MHVRGLMQFLAELSENNNRAWFVMNKPRYDILRAEFLELVARVMADIEKFDPPIAGGDPKRALFRFHRDLRFSRDKRPYKTTFSAAITASGLIRPNQGGGPSYYFHVNGDGELLIAGGEYLPPPARLRAIRERIATDSAGFDKMLKNKHMQGTFGTLQEKDKLARPPKGFGIDTPGIEYVKLKSFVIKKEINLKKQIPTDLRLELIAAFKHAYPLVAWLRAIQ